MSTCFLKTCKRCNIEKNLLDFYVDKRNKDGRQSYCKKCIKEYQLINRNKVYESNKKYHKLNKDKLKNYRKEYYKKKYHNDDLFRLSVILKRRVRYCFKHKGYSRLNKIEDILGADYDLIYKHIESRFKKGMTWDNYGEWHIDHIIPLASAKTEQELIQLCHYTNLQPLWAKENISKGNKIIACRINL